MKLFDELNNREDNWLKLWIVLTALATLICMQAGSTYALVIIMVLYCIFCVGMMYRVMTLQDEE